MAKQKSKIKLPTRRIFNFGGAPPVVEATGEVVASSLQEGRKIEQCSQNDGDTYDRQGRLLG